MKYRSYLAAALFAAVFFGCTGNQVGGSATLVGTHDLVFVDELPGDGTLADPSVDAGISSHYMFVTSTDTNELRVLNMYVPGQPARAFVRAPNPLESLSIPVLDRPQMLAVDEGLSADGRRVTGSYVYAARVGGSQISVVDASPTGFIQITASPLAIGAPITAMSGWMGSGLTAIPATSRLYFATYDGDVGVLWSLESPQTGDDRAAKILAARPTPLLDVSRETIVAMQMIPPVSYRTFDGQPFCATSACVAIATRRASGEQGRALLIELDTLRSAPLAFPGPVRDLAAVGSGIRLFGILDEEKCDSTSCGGVIGIDTSTGVSPSGFPILNDFTGQPMQPLTVSALPRGLTLGESASIQQSLARPDSGTTIPAILASREYDLLGMFSTSAGEIVTFDGIAGTPIDYDGRRPKIIGATLRIPAPTEDGGYAFFTDDGGVTFTAFGGAFDGGPTDPTLDDSNATLFAWTIVSDAGTVERANDQPFSIQIADGYLVSQSIRVIYQGVLTGFNTLPTTSADGNRLTFNAGLEARLADGDRVIFGSLQTDGGVDTCGATTIQGFDAGLLDVVSVPNECVNRVAYTVRASGLKPIVINADGEGYIGRAAPGETITYNRRYIARPEAFDFVHPALVMSMGTVPAIPGAYWEFVLNGFLNPYKISFDTNLCSAGSTIVPGHVVIGNFPRYVNTTYTLYEWGMMTTYPAVNGVAEAPLAIVFDNGLGFVDRSNRDVACWR